MKNKKIQKQRQIGKLLMVVNIIKKEHEGHRGFSFVSSDDLAIWSSIEKEEIATFLDFCFSFEQFNHAFFSAQDIKKNISHIKTDNDNLFLIETIINNKYLFIHHLIYKNQNDYYEEIANLNYEKYCKLYSDTHPISDDLPSSELFRLIFINYVSYFCSLFDEILSYGFDWDVANKIAETNISRKRFDYLKKISTDFTS